MKFMMISLLKRSWLSVILVSCCIPIAVIYKVPLILKFKNVWNTITGEENESHQFNEYASSHTETMHTVCVTKNLGNPTWEDSVGTWYAGDKSFKLPGRLCVPIQKHITVYTNSTPTTKHLNFNIEYLPISQLPSTHTITEDKTAYFLGNRYDFEPENFYHFTKQIYFPLYWLMKNTNQLHSNARNIVFYPKVYGVCPFKGRIDRKIHKYQYYFHKILNIENKHELSLFDDKPDPHNVCYKNAVFSSEIFLDKAVEAMDYFKESLAITDAACKPKILVIVNRHNYRRINNTQELQKVASELGYDARVVALETMTLKEQTQLIHCAEILVGVTGAGLQWAFFMKDYSGVVEIAWPHEQWPFFFSGTGGYNSGQGEVKRLLKFVPLAETKCILNPSAVNTYFKETFYVDGNFTEEESLAILRDRRNYNFWANVITSVGKLCDVVVVNPEAFRAAVVSAADYAKTHTRPPDPKPNRQRQNRLTRRRDQGARRQVRHVRRTRHARRN